MTTPREDAIYTVWDTVTANVIADGSLAEVTRCVYELGQANPDSDIGGVVIQPPTTPREDAIAALAEAIMAAESDDDVPWNERPRPGQVLDNLESLGWRLAALGAEAETPDHAFEPMRDANDPTCSRCLRRHPSWVDLASPETAEALARALKVRVGPKRIEDYDPDEWFAEYATAILAAMRETGRQ